MHTIIKSPLGLALTFLTVLAVLLPLALEAQICDPTLAPANLNTSFSPGTGVTLSWDPVPGSVGMLLHADFPDGTSSSRRLVGSALGQYMIPESFIEPGTYMWRVQAACSMLPPFALSPVSSSYSFAYNSAICPASVTDVDGNTYSTVELGGQCWLGENLRTKHYRNGTNIPTGLDNSTWGTPNNGAYAIYADDTVNSEAYGLLYNWWAVDNPRALCPVSWHVPSEAEWNDLVDHLGGEALAGGAMKATVDWAAPNTGASNGSGFTALPSGYRHYAGFYDGIGFLTYFWSSSESSIYSATILGLYHDNASAVSVGGNKPYGFPVRCLKD
jgi:uncharacterized protein (TIGR02145 family)